MDLNPISYYNLIFTPPTKILHPPMFAGPVRETVFFKKTITTNNDSIFFSVTAILFIPEVPFVGSQILFLYKINADGIIETYKKVKPAS
jgi:hypothetical protein